MVVANDLFRTYYTNNRFGLRDHMFLLVFYSFLLHAADAATCAVTPEQALADSPRLIRILPCPIMDLPQTGDTAAFANVTASAAGSEYGAEMFFSEVKNGPEFERGEEAARVLGDLKRYYELHFKALGEDRNPLLVRCEFFSGETEGRRPCGAIYMGLFVSGNDMFAMDKETCKKMDEAKKVVQQFRNSKAVTDFIEERASQQIEKEGVYYKIPEFCSNGRRVPPISSGDLCTEEGKSMPSHRNNVCLRFSHGFLRGQLCQDLFGHPAQDAEKGSLGCLEGSFSDCFTHSEQAWLNFLDSPRPRHIFFSNAFDIRKATNYDITFFSYKDICRYCRGSFSFLQQTECLQERFNLFLKELPKLMNPHWNKYKINQQIQFNDEFPRQEGTAYFYFPQVHDLKVKLDNLYAWSFCRIDDKLRGIERRRERRL